MTDTTEHTLFDCEKWVKHKRCAETKINRHITAENMIDLITHDTIILTKKRPTGHKRQAIPEDQR